jgi:hypothetical protein
LLPPFDAITFSLKKAITPPLPVDAIIASFLITLDAIIIFSAADALPAPFQLRRRGFSSRDFRRRCRQPALSAASRAITPFSPLILILLIFSPDTLSLSPLMPLFSLMIDTAISLSLLTLQRCCLLPIIFILLLLMPLPLLTPRH